MKTNIEEKDWLQKKYCQTLSCLTIEVSDSEVWLYKSSKANGSVYKFMVRDMPVFVN